PRAKRPRRANGLSGRAAAHGIRPHTARSDSPWSPEGALRMGPAAHGRRSCGARWGQTQACGHGALTPPSPRVHSGAPGGRRRRRGPSSRVDLSRRPRSRARRSPPPSTTHAGSVAGRFMWLALLALTLLAACVIVQRMGILVLTHWLARVRPVLESPSTLAAPELLLRLFVTIVLLHLIGRAVGRRLLASPRGADAGDS